MNSKRSIFTKGILRENPVLVLLLGLCPTLAVSTQVSNAVGMGIAFTFCLLGSNVAISLCHNIIQDKVRIPCYIVVIASFVTITEMVVEAYAYPLYQSLGIFLPLITVNCIVFARAEMFAGKNTVIDSALDALGMGAGFTLALLAMAFAREVFGSGSFFGVKLPVLSSFNVPILTMAPGGFFVFAILIAIVNKVSKGNAIRKKEFGCVDCPAAAACGKGGSN
jgi:electron transport complex protein RnfE